MQGGSLSAIFRCKKLYVMEGMFWWPCLTSYLWSLLAKGSLDKEITPECNTSGCSYPHRCEATLWNVYDDAFTVKPSCIHNTAILIWPNFNVFIRRFQLYFNKETNALILLSSIYHLPYAGEYFDQGPRIANWDSQTMMTLVLTSRQHPYGTCHLFQIKWVREHEA